MRETTAKGAVWYGYDIRHVYKMLSFLLKPLPRRIIDLLRENKNGICVTDLFHTIGTEQSVCSQALGALRRFEIVKTKREGKYIFYYLNQDRVNQIAKAVADVNRKKESFVNHLN